MSHRTYAGGSAKSLLQVSRGGVVAVGAKVVGLETTQEEKGTDSRKTEMKIKEAVRQRCSTGAE